MAISITVDGNYLKYDGDSGKIDWIPLPLYGQCRLVEKTDKVVIVFPQGDPTHNSNPELSIFPTSVYTSVATLLAYLISVQDLILTGGGGTVADAEYKSPIDFSTQRTSASQLTLSNLNIPIVNSSQIKYIIKTNSANTETEVLTNGSGGVSLIWNPTASTIDVKKNGVAYPLFDMGTGLTITTTVSAGAITGGTIISGGTGYYTGGVVLVAGGTGGYFTITATNGVVTAITLLAGGSGYTTAVAAATSVYSYALDVATVVGIDGQEKGYDATSDLFKQFMTNYPVQPLVDDLSDVTTTSGTDIYLASSDGLDMGHHNTLTLTGTIADADTTTMTVEATNDDDLTATGDWIQIYGYNAKTNAYENSWAVTNATLTFALQFKDLKFNNYRVHLVSTNTTATARIKARRTY